MFKLISLRTVLIAVVIAIGMLLAAPSASAGDPQIDAAKAQGVVGERIDGYLALTVLNADPALKRKIEDINARRRALYSQLASRSGVTVEQVARMTGEKQVANAPNGQKVMDDSGQWRQK